MGRRCRFEGDIELGNIRVEIIGFRGLSRRNGDDSRKDLWHILHVRRHQHGRRTLDFNNSFSGLYKRMNFLTSSHISPESYLCTHEANDSKF